jgi:ABC-2 type transport system ATP-binding protein
LIPAHDDHLMIDTTGLTKYYGRGSRRRVAVLSRLDLHVERGSTLAIVGPNGAGKSTLIGVVSGLIRPDAGRVSIAGRLPSEWVRDNGVGLLPAGLVLPGSLTVRALMRRLAIVDGCRGSLVESRVQQALELAGLADRGGQKCARLSRGLRQRFGIAQLLICPRALILLDEPLSGLDPVWRQRFREILDQLRSRAPDTTVLLCTHELGETVRIADRVVVLRAGRLAAEQDVGRDPSSVERRVLETLAPGLER